jgi:hypothetical protein
MVQYVSPFSSVKIATMAAAFGMAPASMLKEVEGLVLQKQIKGRLDLVDGVSLHFACLANNSGAVATGLGRKMEQWVHRVEGGGCQVYAHASGLPMVALAGAAYCRIVCRD